MSWIMAWMAILLSYCRSMQSGALFFSDRGCSEGPVRVQSELSHGSLMVQRGFSSVMVQRGFSEDSVRVQSRSSQSPVRVQSGYSDGSVIVQ